MQTSYNAAVRAIPMPDRIAALPVSDTGYPIPAFVAEVNGVRDFRIADQKFMARAVKQNLCWVCGQPLGRMFAMTLGPMCAINRTISEPPSHKACAIFSVMACPFLSNPRMMRNGVDLPEVRVAPGGIPIARNPGAVAVWMTRTYSVRPEFGANLFTFGDPDEVLWFCKGRKATRDEVMDSINSGYPLLVKAAESDGPNALAELHKATVAALKYVPLT